MSTLTLVMETQLLPLCAISSARQATQQKTAHLVASALRSQCNETRTDSAVLLYAMFAHFL